MIGLSYCCPETYLRISFAGIEYLGANLEAIYHAEGRCTPNGATAFHYEYTLKDHLGNARVNFRANGAAVTFLEEMHYYPFGMQMEGMGTQNPANKYLYNGKERNDDLGLNLSDYGARWYDAALGRWWSVDPMAEKMSGWSSYAFIFNNPLRFWDPDGKAPEDIIIRGENNSSLTVKTDLIDIDIDASSTGIDFEGNVELEGSDVVHAALDIAGVFDPTGAADAANASLYASEGKTKDAIISGLGVTVIGDIFKGKRLVEAFNTIKNAFCKNPGLGNQFKNKTAGEVNKAMEKHVKSGKLEKKHTDATSGSVSYKNKKSGYSYNVDTGKSGKTGKKVEKAHVDVNYPNPKPKKVDKKKLPIKDK